MRSSNSVTRNSSRGCPQTDVTLFFASFASLFFAQPRMSRQASNGYEINLISVRIAQCTRIITLRMIRNPSISKRRRPFSGTTIHSNKTPGVISRCGVMYWISSISHRRHWATPKNYFGNVGGTWRRMDIGTTKRRTVTRDKVGIEGFSLATGHLV